MSDSEDEECICPLCIQPLDATDRAINYCACGFQMCLWCWHKLMETAAKDSLPGKCPNCRTIYDKEKIEIHSINAELLEEERRKKKEEKRRGKGGLPKNKQDLAHIRVVQRNLVYAVGLPLHICREEMLAEKQYFGQFGKTKKISVNRGGAFAQGQAKSVVTGSAYVTFARNEDAMRCIEAIDGSTWDGKPIRACFGTTKYCNAFLKGVVCNNPDCLYLHDIANEDDSFNKDDMNNGTLSKHIMQLVQPLAGERGRGLALAKAPTVPVPQPLSANGTAAPAESSAMTQLGKPQAGPSHVNPWLQHTLHNAAAEGPQSPAKGVPKPPGPNLADQEWPSLHAAVEDHDKDDCKATTSSFTAVLSTTSSLSGDLTVADAVKAAIAAATATKPTAKQAAAAPAKPTTQTITLTKPTKVKTAAVVAASKAKTQVPAAPQVQEPVTTPSVTPPVAPGAPSTPAAATGVNGTRESRVAAAVEAALHPPSPSPSYQQAAAGAVVSTKSGRAAGGSAKSNSPGTDAAGVSKDQEVSEGEAREAAESAGQEQTPESASKTTPPSTSSQPPGVEPPTSTPTQLPPELSGLAATSSAEAHPLSHTSSMSSDLSATATETKPSEPAAEPLTAQPTPADTDAQTSPVKRPILISSSDPPVSPPANISGNMSSASLAGWLGGSETATTAAPVTASSPALTPVLSTSNLPLDPPVSVPSSRPAVPPGFDLRPAGSSTLLKQPSLGSSAAVRGPPPGFSQHWQAAAPAAALAAPAPVAAVPAALGPSTDPTARQAVSPFDVNVFFTAPPSEPVAETVGTGRRQSRFRFAQNGAAAVDTEPTIPASDLHMLGLPGVDERRAQDTAGELSLFRKIFPTAKLNIMPGTSPQQQQQQQQQHTPGPEVHTSTAPWPMAPSHPPPTDPSLSSIFQPHPAVAPLANSTSPPSTTSNPGFALLQQLQRAARAEPAPQNPSSHTAPPPHHTPLGTPYAPPLQASQPLPSSFLDPAIINAKAAPEMGPSPPTHNPAWPPGFGNVNMQYAPPPASIQLPSMASASQPLMFAQQQQQQHAGGVDPGLYGLLRQAQPSLAAQQQQQQQAGYPPNLPAAVRAQQRGPPPGFNPATTSFSAAYSDYSNAYLQQARPPQPNPHMYGMGDHYQATSNHLPNGSDVNKGYMFPTRI